MSRPKSPVIFDEQISFFVVNAASAVLHRAARSSAHGAQLTMRKAFYLLAKQIVPFDSVELCEIALPRHGHFHLIRPGPPAGGDAAEGGEREQAPRAERQVSPAIGFAGRAPGIRCV